MGLAVKGLALILVVLGTVFYSLWHDSVKPPAQNTTVTAATVPIPKNPVEAKEWQIIEQDAEKLGDSELIKDYRAINERYFEGELPLVPVIWEPRLAEVGPLIAKDYRLEGLAHPGKIFILINPAVSSHQPELRRVLCHEMVHVYLYTKGDTKTNHGPDFQTVLQRLSRAGAFQGISATEGEKLSLRSWLKRESARLDTESSVLERENSELERIGVEIENRKGPLELENRELNQRISRANGQGYGWPSDDEIGDFKATTRLLDQRVAVFNAKVAEFNASAERHNADSKQFNRSAGRYNLMMAYPDGLDEESVI